MLQFLMLDAGIIPDIDLFSTQLSLKLNNIDNSMSSLSAEQQRIYKRRFRKLWRKAARKYGYFEMLQEQTGGLLILTEKSIRRNIVKRMLCELAKNYKDS